MNKPSGQTGQTSGRRYVRVGDTVSVGKFKGEVVASDNTGRLWVTDEDGDSFIIHRRAVT